MNLMKLHPNRKMTFSEWAAMMIAWPLAWIVGGILMICMKIAGERNAAKQ